MTLTKIQYTFAESYDRFTISFFNEASLADGRSTHDFTITKNGDELIGSTTTKEVDAKLAKHILELHLEGEAQS